MLIQYIADYLEYLQAERGLAQNTIDAYRRDLFAFTDFLYLLEELDDFEKIRNELAEEKVKNYISSFSIQLDSVT